QLTYDHRPMTSPSKQVTVPTATGKQLQQSPLLLQPPQQLQKSPLSQPPSTPLVRQATRQSSSQDSSNEITHEKVIKMVRDKIQSRRSISDKKEAKEAQERLDDPILKSNNIEEVREAYRNLQEEFAKYRKKAQDRAEKWKFAMKFDEVGIRLKSKKSSPSTGKRRRIGQKNGNSP
ncbi:hypothetical protein PFISCL1PPCAC_7189, partial [Pristionchus fissidentatus]